MNTSTHAAAVTQIDALTLEATANFIGEKLLEVFKSRFDITEVDKLISALELRYRQIGCPDELRYLVRMDTETRAFLSIYHCQDYESMGPAARAAVPLRTLSYLRLNDDNGAALCGSEHWDAIKARLNDLVPPALIEALVAPKKASQSSLEVETR